MDLIVITYPEFFAGEAEILTEILRDFSITLHIRKPDATDDQYQELLEGIPEELHSEIVLHGAYALSEKYDLKGLHFSTSKRVLASRFPDVFKSTSCHSVEEVLYLHDQFHSLFLSPVYPSISKKGYEGNLDLKKIKELLKRFQISNVVALGGINASRLETVERYGFRGAAVLGSVWGIEPENKENILSNMKKLQHEKDS